jgi:hypothetical protein
MQRCIWVLLQLSFTYKLTPVVIFSGSVAAPAMVVHRQVDSRLSSNISILYILQHLPQSLVLTQGAPLEPVPVRTISVLTTSSMERLV